jgi:Domain of unknown function (DUF4037)
MEQRALRDRPLAVAREVADRYRTIPEVVAVALGGSQTAGAADGRSDIDLYIYCQAYPAAVPIAARAAVAAARRSQVELDNRFFEPGDEWIETSSGLTVDVTFRHTAWIEGELDRVLGRHEASLGYSTCLWANVLSSYILFDRGGWFAALQARASQPYPESLRRAIIAKNHLMLRRAHSAYRHQLEHAVARGDLVSVNHRVAALLASYFDIIFALNRLPHPGEKRLLAVAAARCTMLPPDMTVDVHGLLRAAGSADAAVLQATDRLVDALDQLLVDEALITR